MSYRYEKLLGACRPVHQGDAFSIRHPRMPRSQRAKIFKPFAALSGFEEAIADKDIVFSPRRDHSAARLNQSLNRLLPLCGTASMCRRNPTKVKIIWFEPVILPTGDGRNNGETCGIYETITGIVKEIDLIGEKIRITPDAEKKPGLLSDFRTGPGTLTKEITEDRIIDFKDIDTLVKMG